MRERLVERNGVTRHYTFIDYATQGYMITVGVLILLLHGTAVSIWPGLLLAHIFAVALVHLLIVGHARFPSNRLLDFLRHCYPILLYGFFYRETGELNQMTTTGYLDPFFIRLEGSIFGGQPSVAFMQDLPYWPVSEVFYAAYFLYYLMIAGVGLALFMRDRRQFYHYVSVVSFVFYVCYLIYIFTPVIGPPVFHQTVKGYELPPEFLPSADLTIPATIQSGLFFRIMAWICDNLEAPGAAFPSSHVAVALTTVYFSFRYLRAVRVAHLVVVVLLALATVYCRYHYAVDVIAGVITALVLVPVGNCLYLRFQKPESGAATVLPNSPVQSDRS